ncbi:MAG TPA: hypothetical protein VNM92_12135 [Thermoanaerobaculia bacterium]|nr:hypothetical protein [Thermoanaerobaculia bacterium]
MQEFERRCTRPQKCASADRGPRHRHRAEQLVDLRLPIGDERAVAAGIERPLFLLFPGLPHPRPKLPDSPLAPFLFYLFLLGGCVIPPRQLFTDPGRDSAVEFERIEDRDDLCFEDPLREILATPHSATAAVVHEFMAGFGCDFHLQVAGHATATDTARKQTGKRKKELSCLALALRGECVLHPMEQRRRHQRLVLTFVLFAAPRELASVERVTDDLRDMALPDAMTIPRPETDVIREGR